MPVLPQVHFHVLFKTIQKMKKLLLKFANEVLSREELKSVRGASNCGTCQILETGLRIQCVSEGGGCRCLAPMGACNRY